MASFCEHDNDFLCYIKVGEFFDQQSDCQLLYEGSALCIILYLG